MQLKQKHCKVVIGDRLLNTTLTLVRKRFIACSLRSKLNLVVMAVNNNIGATRSAQSFRFPWKAIK